MTSWPTRSSSASPKSAAGRPAALARSTARSLAASVPRTSASASTPSANVTSTRREPSTTWLLVTTSPSGAMTMPDPLPLGGSSKGLRRRPQTETFTTAGRTLSATSMTARL